MSLRLRFLLSLLSLLALMTIPALYAAGRVNVLRDIVLELQGQSAQSALAAGRLQAALGQADQYQRAYVATADAALAARMRGSLEEAVAEIATLRAAGYGDVVDRVGLHLDQLEDVTDRIELLVQQRQLDTATTYLMTAATPLFEQARAALPALASAIDARTNERVGEAKRSAVAAGAATRLTLAAAIILAIALALGAASALTRPIDRVRFAMARVAEGAFDAPADLPYGRSDELGHLSRSFRSMTLRLAELDRLKAEFVGTASHDLNTPVSIISGYAELLEEELEPWLQPRHREMLNSVGEQADTLRRRVDQLLELSRMEAGRLELGLEEINLRHFAAELQRSFEPVARARGITLRVDVDERVSPFLIADPDVLRTDVLGNLIGNAIKFTPGEGVITVSVEPDGDRVHLEVADTGCGIPADQLPHVFDKYYQGRTPSGGAGGAGLGLAIARAAVEAHGGRLNVSSQVGHGSRFRATLPVRATPPATSSLPTRT
jgi:signal transduction histidine kinase